MLDSHAHLWYTSIHNMAWKSSKLKQAPYPIYGVFLKLRSHTRSLCISQKQKRRWWRIISYLWSRLSLQSYGPRVFGGRLVAWEVERAGFLAASSSSSAAVAAASKKGSSMAKSRRCFAAVPPARSAPLMTSPGFKRLPRNTIS